MGAKMDLERWIAWDETVSQRLRLDRRRGGLPTLLGLLSHTGDGWLWIAWPLAAWLWGDAAWRHIGQTFLVGVLLTAGVVTLLKFTIRRRRPQGQWGQMYRKTDPHSFPSGHAARAAMLALLGWAVLPAPWAALLSLWGLAVAATRVLMGVHYLSDVVAGVLLGWLMAGVVWGLQGPLGLW